MLHLILDFVVTEIILLLHLLDLHVLDGSSLSSLEEVLLKLFVILRIPLELLLALLHSLFLPLLKFIQIVFGQTFNLTSLSLPVLAEQSCLHSDSCLLFVVFGKVL